MLNEKSSIDKIIELYKKDVDISLIKENLKLSYEERILKLQNLVYTFEEFKNAKLKENDRVSKTNSAS
jgi:hypothetical protein